MDDLWSGDLDDWQLGLDMQGPLGKRQGHLAVRNAELRLSRERTVLREQQRQILHDLSAAYTEVDRALANIRTAYNSYIATQEELEPKRLRVEEGKDQVFFLLDAQQRFANSESAFYRAIVDYNRALLNYSYVSGNLLGRYNVQLEEGDWDSGLQMIAHNKADRFVTNGWGSNARDLPPVTEGPYQQLNANTTVPTFTEAPMIEAAPTLAPEDSDDGTNQQKSNSDSLPIEPSPEAGSSASDKHIRRQMGWLSFTNIK
ncbi:MAG: TolC family protein [Pirellulaceae bacterium]